MKRKVILTTILFLVLCTVFFCIYVKFYDEEKYDSNIHTEIYETSCGEYKKGEIIISSKTLSVDIADDNCKRNLGLSGKTSLNDRGMFFVFDNIGFYPFWMKEMLFSIDMLWIGDDFKVVGLEKDVATDTYPKTFGEKYLARYVLEVPAQYSEKNNIKIGDKIIFAEK